jgi:hypothetical protein
MSFSLVLTLAGVFVASILGIVLADAILTGPRRRDMAPPLDRGTASTTEATVSPTAPEPPDRDERSQP